MKGKDDIKKLEMETHEELYRDGSRVFTRRSKPTNEGDMSSPDEPTNLVITESGTVGMAFNPNQKVYITKNSNMENKKDTSNSGMESNDYIYRFGSSTKKIRRFPSGAVRSDDTGRIRPDYISPYAIDEIAAHFTTAKNDFGPTNYFLGIKPAEVLPSVMRHVLEIHEGLMIGDAGMVRNGFRSLGANSIMALHQIVLEEKGLYKEIYDSTELVNAKEYLKELEG